VGLFFKALNVILKGRRELLDCMRINGTQYAMYSISAGAFTSATYTTPQEAKRALGLLAYGLEGIRKNIPFRIFSVDATDGITRVQTESVFTLIMNSKCVAGLKMNKDASMRDGIMECAVIKQKAKPNLYNKARALLALGKGAAVLYVGCALVLLGPIVQGKGWGKLTGVFGSLYNHVTGYFGDILSYTRLMALMLAGSVIAQVFNMLAAMPGNVIAFIIISMLGNAMNFGLNLLGCYVHDLRLQCLEFFNKFYVDGGKPFRPMTLDTEYVDLQ